MARDTNLERGGPGFRQDLSRRLREIQEAGGGRYTVATAAGSSRSGAQKWLDAVSPPSFEAMAQLGRTTGYSLEWLAYGIEPKKRLRQLDGPIQDPQMQGHAEAVYDEIVNYINAFSSARAIALPQRHLHRLAEEFLDYVLRYDDQETRAAVLEVLTAVRVPAVVDQVEAPEHPGTS